MESITGQLVDGQAGEVRAGCLPERRGQIVDGGEDVV